MSIQRPHGPIGHCSAKLRRLLSLEEEEIGKPSIRIKDQAKQAASNSSARGNRFTRVADFSVPGTFGGRFISTDGRSTFHFSLEPVSKTADGGCRITSARGTAALAKNATAEHDSYLGRDGAVLAITPANFDGYAVRTGAVAAGEHSRAIRSNISEDPGKRRRYWLAVHKHENAPGKDRITFTPKDASRAAWQRLAGDERVPAPVRAIAAELAKPGSKRKERKIPLEDLGLDPDRARQCVETIRDVLGPSGKGARLSLCRGGRVQYRLTAELPQGLDDSGRFKVMNQFCDELEQVGFMYVAAIHAPDFHKDHRNYHLHIAFHDPPARMIGDRWDFEIAEPVPGQSNRLRYPHEQKKIEAWSRAPGRAQSSQLWQRDGCRDAGAVRDDLQ